MSFDQMHHYQSKLAFEMDSSDLFSAIEDGKEPISVIDSRSPSAWSEQHIPGSINLWHKDICTNRTSDLDPRRIYVCYCDGIGCNASTKAALKLLVLGFRVRELIGGLDWWIRDGYATEGSQARAGRAPNCGC